MTSNLIGLLYINSIITMILFIEYLFRFNQRKSRHSNA